MIFLDWSQYGAPGWTEACPGVDLSDLIGSDLVGLEWSGFGGQIHSKAPGAPRTLNLNRTNGCL